MLHIKPFSLKLLFFGVGILPLFVLAIISKQDMNKSPENLLWFGLFGAVLIASILVQQKLRKLSPPNLKEMSTYAAFLLVALPALFLLRQFLNAA